MKRFTHISILLILLLPSLCFSQEEAPGQDVPQADKEEEEKKEASSNVNIDAKVLYGQYNNILSDFSVTQGLTNFSYQLNSNFKRSNDYGYGNTSFFESQIGFTGMADFTESWKFTPLLEVSNDSRGLYDNPVYSREERDSVVLQFANEYKPTPSRWDFVFGGAHYVHRLMPSAQTSVNRCSFYKANGGIGWEYGWSTSIRARLKSKVAHYDYSTSADNDTFVSTELTGSFKLTEYIMIDLGPSYSWNRDAEHFYAGKVSVSTVSLKYFSMELSYQYDLKPFEPEIVYVKQRYVMPDFSLTPDRVQHAECKMGIEIQNSSTSGFYVKSVKLKGIGIFEKNRDYYNFYLIAGNIVYPMTMALMSVKAKGDMTLELQILRSNLKIGITYEYCYFHTGRHVTYKPEYSYGGLVKFKVGRVGFEWNNTLSGSVYTDPYLNNKIGRSLIGSFSLSVNVLETFYLYGKIENMYDTRYYYRVGYPEPGRLFLGGLRIQI